MNGGRRTENGLAILGGVMAACYVGLVEILPHACHALGRCAAEPMAGHGIPWGVVILVGALVLPKTVGRATAGKVWEAIGSRFARLSGTSRRPPPEEEP